MWTSYGWAADWCELVVRTDPAAPKHKGLTVLLVDMKSPGVEVRPLRQMTGETEFNEVFFRDVRVPVENVVGNVNQGWDVAIGTLMHERGTFGAGLQITYKRNMERLIALSRTVQRDGRPAAEDPVIRQKLAQCYAEVADHAREPDARVQPHQRTGVPGPEGSIQKIFWSELNQRLQQVAQELLGPVRAARRPRSARDRSRRVVVRLPARARQHDRSRHVGNPAQHHRPFRARPAAKLLMACFGLNENQVILRDSAREFFAGECPPAYVRRADRDRPPPTTPRSGRSWRRRATPASSSTRRTVASAWASSNSCC